jgi:probable HAF family extracellular repeat protein
MMIVLAFVLAGSQSAAAPTYTLTDLGTFGGTSSCALAINTAGQVVGWATLPGDSAAHAFLYSGGTKLDLGTLGAQSSLAFGINNLGQVVGSFADAPGETNEHAFVYANGTTTDLHIAGRATAINDQGDVVGFTPVGSPTSFHAFRYSGGVTTDLGTLGGSWSWAYAINNSGLIAGAASTSADAAFHGFLFGDGALDDLPGLIAAEHLNDLGQIVGVKPQFNPLYGTLQRPGLQIGSRTLGIGLPDGFKGIAYGINKLGEAVGYDQAYSGNPIAFFWDGAESMDLNSLIDPATGVTVREAFAINDLGQIAALGQTRNGESHALLLTPIPEPANLCAIALAGAATLLRRSADRNRGRRAVAGNQRPPASNAC